MNVSGTASYKYSEEMNVTLTCEQIFWNFFSLNYIKFYGPLKEIHNADDPPCSKRVKTI